ncbi:MAG: hybrid sensor histidine kinase/response regulator [Gammaproteobacteria bacterium]
MEDPGHDPDSMTTRLQHEVRDRFGVLPNFFRLAADALEIKSSLWGFARFGYLDNPLPSLFKERLFVYLSRYCNVRYCIARHVGFLVGLGRPAGDQQCPPETVEQAIRLIRRPLPQDDALEPHLAVLQAWTAPLTRLPESDSPAEEAIFACAAHMFLQTTQAARCAETLRRLFDETTFQYLTVFLTFIHTAHYWTRMHPELELEDDVNQLLETHEALAQCVLDVPEASTVEVTQLLLDELTTLRRERALRKDLQRVNRFLQASEERLREQDRRKDEYLATLAHELRNPLAPIRSGLEVLKLRPGGEAADKAWDMIERQLGQMVRLVDDLLDVSRISRGKVDLRKERIDVASMVNQAVEAIAPLCKNLGHDLTVTLPPEAVYLYADPTRLTQVLINLLDNACKFTEGQGHIRLIVERDGRQLVIRVIDTGIGLPADQLPGIFEMFTQVEKPLEREHGGLGIGLTLAKRMLELHDGTIEARSAGVGQGSEFVVRLPALDESTELPSPQPSAAGQTATIPRRILVVDDNRDAADSLAMLLTLTGHEVHTAHEGLEAVEAAAKLRPDLVLLDIGLPKLNGYEAARRIREQPWGKGMVLVALTGWSQEKDRQKSREAGFDDHFVKPLDHAAFMKMLDGLGGYAA